MIVRTDLTDLTVNKPSVPAAGGEERFWTKTALVQPQVGTRQVTPGRFWPGVYFQMAIPATPPRPICVQDAIYF